MEQKCGDCALKALKNGMCPVFNANMEDEGGCPYFTTELHFCDVCGSPILGSSILAQDGEAWKQMCNHCNTKVFGTCDGCAKFVCRFRTDQSINIPLMINVQKRQGNMVVQTQQMNPERVKVTCMNGCPCWHSEENEGFCMMEACGSCENYQTKWRD